MCIPCIMLWTLAASVKVQRVGVMLFVTSAIGGFSIYSKGA